MTHFISRRYAVILTLSLPMGKDLLCRSSFCRHPDPKPAEREWPALPFENQKSKIKNTLTIP
jgi:hypothetical protein